MKLFEVIQEVIRLGDASQAYWERELPRHHPRYPVILYGEQPAPPPPEDAQIAKLLENLPDNQILRRRSLDLRGARGLHRGSLLVLSTKPFERCYPRENWRSPKSQGRKRSPTTSRTLLRSSRSVILIWTA